MAGVVKNMIVRVGADISGLIGEFKKSGKATENFANQASNALRQATLSEANLKKAMAQGGKNSYIVNLTDQIRELEQEQKALKAAGFGWGYEGFEQNEALLRNLKSELNDYIKSVREAGNETDEMEEEVEELGSTSRRSGGWLQNIKNFFSGMKTHSFSAKNGVESLLRSIRRLGVVSLGLRFVRSIFGELGSVVRQYISENDALQAQVNALKSSLGQALAPAINVVTNALAKMMPYIVGISNAIGSLISSLFGPGWTTIADGANSATKAIGGAGRATNDLKRSLQGFDEITKLNAKDGGGGGSSSSSGANVESALPGWATSLIDKVKEEIAAGDWRGVGQVIAESLNAGIDAVNSWDISFGGKISQIINNGLDTTVGFIQNYNWYEAGQLLSKNISDLFTGISWSTLFEGLGSLVGGAVSGLIGMLENTWENLSSYFQGYIDDNIDEFEDVGDAIFQGIWEGLCDAVKNVGKWIKENVFNPIVEGFKKTFKIHSPAAHPEIRDIGKNIILGVFEGILEIAKSPLEWIKTNVFNPIQQAMQNLFDGTSMADFKVGVKNESSKWWSNVKNWWSQKVGEVKLFTTGVKNEAASWWTNVQEWWRQSVGEVKSFSTGVVNDSETWWSNVKTWWDGKKGTLLMDAFVRDGASDWWENVKTWWDGKKGKLLMDAFVRDDSKTWWENVKTWWTNAVGTLKLEIKLPKIEVEWGKLSALGQTFDYPKSFSLKWNEYGAILNGAQIFGRLGDTLLGGGEAGREALLPLDRHTGWMDDIADRVAARIGGVGTQEQQITVNVPLDGKILASTVVRVINGQARATGHNPLSAWI